MRQGLLLGVGVLVVAVVLIAGTRRQEPAASARFLRWAGFGLVVGDALLGLERTRAAGVLLVLLGAGNLLALTSPAGGVTVWPS